MLRIQPAGPKQGATIGRTRPGGERKFSRQQSGIRSIVALLMGGLCHGYPERFAQEALGHNSKAVHRAYARNAQVTVPSLEEYENPRAGKKVIPLPFDPKTEPASSGQNDRPVAETRP